MINYSWEAHLSNLPNHKRMCIQKYIAKATGFCNKDYSLRTEIHDIHVDVYNTYLYCAVVLGLKKKVIIVSF